MVGVNWHKAVNVLVAGDFFTVKVDHNFSPNDSLSVTYALDDSERDQAAGLPEYRGITFNRKQTFALTEHHVFSPTVVNELRLGWSRTTPGETEVHLEARPDLAFVPGTPTENPN